MLSILIPTYNYNVSALVNALHSQLEGISTPIEIIVLDDGSSSFIKEHEALNALRSTRFIISENNEGRTATRNKLAKLASYNWLLFLDADVLPLRQSFLKAYIASAENTTAAVIFGGISYEAEKPSKAQLFRWHYGRHREAKPVSEREKAPYFIISQNLCIQKETFLKANNIQGNYYGLDNYFSNQLERMQVEVKHIDNPVIHLGLETTKTFITKALKAVETTVILEEKGVMDVDARPLQKSYLKLKKFGLAGIFTTVMTPFKGMMERNFESSKPNLFWFDIYRLAYYTDLKRKKNA
ncbi:glycosyltransferase family A protein [Ulvibacter litoralis]|uniref:Glycosyl transferase family 2 n=1 Tax=Ulvibacter litoralis TaxID=227084 RepID=A0A1G7INX8_9FLAO|nr:glycosyltransferase family A protein [Ulvibacter litoralis]GHC61384.1 glycosyl transferase [Ulvibacter litoralis]SDF14009.1 Glycosyl transferase family 2 [Ulvibacter litoralis]